MSSNTKKINLVWDAWSKQGPMPNGLHPKYREEWDSHWKNQYGTNVLTRFIPYDRYSLGFFPVLLSQCNITYENITPKNVVLDDPEVENWYVMEPNHMDISLITENMFGNIDFKVIKLLREKKIKLVFYYAFEAFPFQQVDWLKTIQRSLGWLQIPSSQFVLIFGDLNLGENYQQFLSNHDQYYGYTFENLFVFDHFGWEFWDYLKTFVLTNPEQKELVPGTDEIRDRKRPHRFLNLNGGARPHRKYLLTELKRQGILDKGLYSYLNKFDIHYDPSLYCYKPIKKFDQDLSLVEMMAYHREHGNKIEEKHLDVDASEDAWHNRGMTAQHYQDTYFNIVSETWPADPSFFVTEKIFKPIVNLQPFVVCGLPGNLQYLKNKGFETFPEWFTEDYDTVQGHPQRMHYLTEQIVKVINWDDETIHRKYQDTWEKCLFNRKHFFAMNHAIEFTDLVNAIGDL